jgi:ribosomal protein S18 acetylase RimI-like enzyme
MSEILKDFSAPALVMAIEANHWEFWAFFGRSPQVEPHDDLEMMWLVSGIPHPGFNGVFRTQLAPGDIDARTGETLAHFKSRKLPMIWWIGPSTRPANLGKYLETHGLTHTAEPGMAVDLLALKENLPKPPSLEIERVRDVETLKKFSHAANLGFGIPDSVGDAIFDIEASLGFGRHLPRHHYVGLLKGEPVATSTLLLGAGVAGIYTIATIPEARRQGIGSAMTLAPLREARAMGYRIGVLRSSQMGLNMYRQLGFKEYCKVDCYLWTGEAGQSERPTTAHNSAFATKPSPRYGTAQMHRKEP